jgi:DNA-binding SARP family transcriptional activator/tetratricopeptide (TPR) repeat protein
MRSRVHHDPRGRQSAGWAGGKAAADRGPWAPVDVRVAVELGWRVESPVISRDRLVDELWGEAPPPGAVKALQVHVAQLRRSLAKALGVETTRSLLETRSPGYVIHLAPDDLDLTRFEAAIDEARRALDAGHPARAHARATEGLALWRGPPLAGVDLERSLHEAASRLEALRVSAQELAVEAALRLGRHDSVLPELEALVKEHPLRERLREQMMLCLYRAGRQAEALEAYQATRRALVDELGIEPGRSVRELHQAILRQDPALDPPPVAPEPAREMPRIAFVGRAPELDELLGGLDDAFGGRGRLFLLAGEPGIGKSRLAEELVAHARERGARVLAGRCWEAGGAPAYWPWVQSLRAYIREAAPETLRGQLGAGAAELAQVLPELHDILPGLPEPTPPVSEGARFRLFDATVEFLRNAAEDRPIVLVLDDLHAADAPSLLLLQLVARGLGSSRILVLGAFRNVDPIPSQPLTELLAEVSREPITRRLELGGLSEGDVAKYVELTSSEIASPELVAALHEETNGNPLFVAETVRLLSVEGVRSEPNAEVRIAIPQSVRDVIGRRLSHLSEECHRVLVLACVLGREFALSALARLSGVSEDQLLDTLDEAMAARIVADVPGGAGRLRFAHILIRDTLYEGLTAARRVRLHRQALEALEALYDEDAGPHLAELVHHSIAGRDFDMGLRYARRAGDRALALLAYEEASRLYETALRALDLADVRDEKSRCELLLSLGEAEAREGNTPAAQKAFLGASGIAQRLGLARELARAAVGYGGRIVLVRAGDDDQLVPMLEAALAALGDQDPALQARLLARLAGALRDEPSRDRRDRLSGASVELARRAGTPADLAYALDGRASAIVAPDTVEECLALGTELRDVARLIGDRERLVAGHYHRLNALLQVGDLAAAEADLAAASRIADELGQPAQLWQACAAQAMLALAAGRLDAAEELVSQAFAYGERALPDLATPAYCLQRHTLWDFRGSLEALEPAMYDLVAEYPARPAFRCALAHLLARLNRLPEAKRELDDLARDDCSGMPFDQEWLYGMSLLAETSALVRDIESARVLYRLLAPWAPRNAADEPEGFRGSVSRYLGVLATTMTRWNEAARHFEYALEMNERMGSRPWVAHTQRDYAQMLLARNEAGDDKQALELIRSSVATYRELGMSQWAHEASELESAPRVA